MNLTLICFQALADRIEKLTELEILSYCKQLASALYALQFKLPGNSAVIHGDIHPGNILLKKDHGITKYNDIPYILKLADFGLAKTVSKDIQPVPAFSTDKSIRDPDIYTPDNNEQHNKGFTYSFVTDLFSVAVVCAQMLLKKKMDELKALNSELETTKLKTENSYQKKIAQFCLDVIDYKSPSKIRPSKLPKGVNVNPVNRAQTTTEVKLKLDQFILTLKEEERFYRENNLNQSQDSKKKEVPNVLTQKIVAD